MELLHLLNSTLLASLLLYLLIHAQAANHLNKTQKLALLDIQSHLTNFPDDAFSSWNDSLQFCQWRGVKCSNKQDKVISLNLRRMNLYGDVSPFIGNLSFLKSLDLSQNFLTGIVPPELGRLTRLQNLNLSFNLITGAIPENLSNCSNLINISLGNNFLKNQIPPKLASLPILERLHLHNNNLTGNFPASFGNTSSLHEIYLTYNHVSGKIPETIGSLKKLTYLDLGINQFSGIFPPAIYNLSKLTHLGLTMNKLQGDLRQDIGVLFPHIQTLWLASNSFTGQIPLSLQNASTLLELELSSNQFTGNVPSSLGNLKNLTFLNLSNNSLGNLADGDLLFLTSLANCSNLKMLQLSMNNFGSALTSSITNLSSTLEWLSIFSNTISGTVPEEIARLTGLTTLLLHNNLFTGIIPTSIGTLPKVRRLYLYNNRLTGEIPSSLGNLTQLRELFMFNNSLHGNLPAALGNLKLLREARFSRNKLNGTIPPQFIGLSSLTIALNLSHNLFTGPLPDEVGNLTSLTALDVSYNNLSGNIPRNLGSCISLNSLTIQNNLFRGNIPDLSQLRGLQFLDLSENNLSGHIPEYFAKLPSLVNLNLSYNDFDGEVPAEGIFLNVTAVQVYGNSKLCGEIAHLNLLPCHVRRHKSNVNLKIILPIIGVFSCLLLSLSLLFVCRKKSSTRIMHSSETSFGRLYPKISFKELYDSTEGFSSNNLIGAGSFGVVYVGVLGQGELPIAVKVLNLQQNGASRSFLAECEALGSIRHRNLVKLVSVCAAVDYKGNDFKALIYPFMSNGSLEKWLHQDEVLSFQGKLNLSQKINIAIDIASALQYLHHQCPDPVVHCDLKPSNVLLDSDLTAHVSDFGLARVLSKLKGQSDQNQFSSLGIKGTIGYTAPEYGVGCLLSIQGDVYSYGILLLELFTGRRPVDETFKDNHNLRNFVKLALLDVVLEIIDQSPLLTEKQKCESNMEVVTDCLVSVLKIGIACSVKNPQARINMKQVVHELVSVKEKFLGMVDENIESPKNRFTFDSELFFAELFRPFENIENG